MAHVDGLQCAAEHTQKKSGKGLGTSVGTLHRPITNVRLSLHYFDCRSDISKVSKVSNGNVDRPKRSATFIQIAHGFQTLHASILGRGLVVVVVAAAGVAAGAGG